MLTVTYSGLPWGTEGTHRFSTWNKRRELAEAYEAALGFAQYAKPWALTLIGPPGVGKTHLALAAAWDWGDAWGGVRYWQVARFLDALRQGYDDGTYHSLIRDAENCGLLVLDDLGVESPTVWARQQLDTILDTRYVNRYRTIVTTNLGLAELPARIADRLSEGKVVRIQAPSWRPRRTDDHR